MKKLLSIILMLGTTSVFAGDISCKLSDGNTLTIETVGDHVRLHFSHTDWSPAADNITQNNPNFTKDLVILSGGPGIKVQLSRASGLGQASLTYGQGMENLKQLLVDCPRP